MQTEKLLWYLGFMCRGSITINMRVSVYSYRWFREGTGFIDTSVKNLMCSTAHELCNCLHIALSLGSIRNVSSWEMQQQRSTKCCFLQPWAPSYGSMAIIFSFRKLLAAFLWLVHWLVKVGIAHSSDHSGAFPLED